MLDRDDIVTAMARIGLPPGQYRICTGAALVLHGVKASTRDIDIGCAPAVIDSVLAAGGALLPARDGRRAAAYGDMEFFEDWAADDTVDMDGLTVTSLPAVRRQKLALGRPKDYDDITLIDAFMEAAAERRGDGTV